jgi:micrococcal nuclease
MRAGARRRNLGCEENLSGALDTAPLGRSSTCMLAALVLTCLNPPVHDGDSLRCQGQKVRIAVVDAPEIRGSYSCSDARRARAWCDFAAGERARLLVVSMTKGREVRCTVAGPGRYGRVDARCVADGRDIGRALLKAGLGRVEPLYARRYGPP